LGESENEENDPAGLEERAEVIEFGETRRNSLLSCFFDLDDDGSRRDEPYGCKRERKSEGSREPEDGLPSGDEELEKRG